MKKPILKVQTISVYISTTLVLLLLGVMGLLFVAAQEVSKSIRNNLEVSVIMNGEVEEEKILKLKEQLGKRSYTQDVIYISKEQALEEQKQSYIDYENQLDEAIEGILKSGVKIIWQMN
jgi:cell division transport system permease protein